MRNIITFALFFFTVTTFAQRKPIQPYNENGYTLQETKNFALGSTEISFNWRNEVLQIVNTALKEVGEDLVLTQSHVAWLLDHTQDSTVFLENFINSGRVDSKIQFFADKNFKGIVKVFVHGKCRVILMKTICLNLLKVPAEKIPTPAPKQVDPPVEVRDTIHKKVILIQPEVHTFGPTYYYSWGRMPDGGCRPRCSSGTTYAYNSPWGQPRTTCNTPRPSCGGRGYYGPRRTGR